MSWYLEHLNRDGSVHQRMMLPDAPDAAIRIGRALDNDLVLDDLHCAPYHAVLRHDKAQGVILHDLNSINGLRIPVRFGRSQRRSAVICTPKRPHKTRIQIGNSSLGLRHSQWEMKPEKPLSTLMIWPLALVALCMVLLHEAWTIWLGAVHIDNNTPYLAKLSGLAAVLAIWSIGYSLLGRVLGGVDRFFNHLLIVCIAYLSEVFLQMVLEQVAFSFNWLWPLQIQNHATVIVIALTARAHLRLADPRHWPVMRWGVGLATFLAIGVPIGQMWMTNQRLTNTQLVDVVQHPMTLLVEPTSMKEFMLNVQGLQPKADAQRKADAGKDDQVDDFLIDED
jgi:hypothetical protein